MEPIPAKIDVDKWAALKTGDVDRKKTGGQSGPTAPGPELGGGPKTIPEMMDSLIKPVVS